MNKEEQPKCNSSINPVIILSKVESLKTVLDARYLNSLIDESKCNWPIEPIQVILTKINDKCFTTADLNSVYNQKPLDEQSRRVTQFIIGNQQYEFNRLFYGISIGPAAFSAFMNKIFRPLKLSKNATTYLDDVFMQSQTKEEMFIVLEMNNFEWTTDHQTRFEEIKTLLTEQMSNTIPDTDQPFDAMCEASNFGIGAALLQSHNATNKMNLILTNSRLFTHAELRPSTLMRECTAIIYTLTLYEFLILGSKHPRVLFTYHKHTIFLFTQKSNPKHRVYRFQLFLMNFPNLHIVWTARKNLALPDTLSKNTPPEL